MKGCPLLAMKLQAHMSGSPPSSSRFHREAVTLKNKVQLIQAFVIATARDEKNVQDPKQSFLYNNGLFREPEYLIKLCNLSSVS